MNPWVIVFVAVVCMVIGAGMVVLAVRLKRESRRRDEEAGRLWRIGERIKSDKLYSGVSHLNLISLALLVTGMSLIVVSPLIAAAVLKSQTG